MANKYPLIFNNNTGLIQEVSAGDGIISDQIETTTLVVTGTLAIPGGGSLDTLRFRSFGISNDPTVYSGTGSIVSNKLVVSGISTTRFLVGEKVKLIGVTTTSDSVIVPPTTTPCSFARIGNYTSGTTYRYWVSQYHYRNGKVGISSQATPTVGIAVTSLGDFNDVNHISLTLQRTSTDNGLLVYRSEDSASIDNAKLIAILGPKELENSTTGIIWKDYGSYERTEWSSKTSKNEFDDDQIHFPNTGTATTASRRGWAIDTVTAVGSNSITVNGNYNLNTTPSVKVIHDNTYAFKLAIDSAISDGVSSLVLPSGTYYTQSLVVPTGFALKGEGKNTIIKKQFFANDLTDGAGNSLSFGGNLVGIGTTNAGDITLQSLTIDGNNTNNILFDGEINNYLLNFENISSTLFSDVEIRNSPGHGLYVYNSRRLSIQNCEFVDGSLTDRYSFSPLNAQESEVLRINNSLFEDYPGALDISVTSVVSTNGNIIRNCGTGIRVYAAGKFTTTGNIVLGPSDEFIPTNDIYDSDFNSINLNIIRGATFNSPVMLYIEDGVEKDISSSLVSISAGIATIINAGLSSETLGTKFLSFNIPTADAGIFGRENGYIQLTLPSGTTSTLGISSALGYDVIGTEYLDIPTGTTTTVGIFSGSWNVIGAGATQYTVTLSDPNQFSTISIGDTVKLINHSVTPDLSARELKVESKIEINSATKNLRLTGFTTTSVSNGGATGYISIRNIFLIAKGRIGVT